MTNTRSFARSLSNAQMQSLHNATNEQDHWWRDLLSLWKPSGTDSGDYGLRLAVRKGYLNFYRKGQSIARVSFDRAGAPKLSVHLKYVCSDEERGAAGQTYASLTAREITQSDLTARPYESVETIKGWIDVVNRHYAAVGGEKPLIDQLLDNQANNCVIDLEMGLPAPAGERSAPRMDVVTIEEVDGRLAVVFGEVKRIDDSRVRSSTGAPEVINQLKKYELYLADEANRTAISDAYRAVAVRMTELAIMARAVGCDITLADTVARAAAGEALDVTREAVLVVVRSGEKGEGNWENLHKPRFAGQLKFVEVRPGGAMNLGTVV